ncbi:ergothioneine biosynthesis protein EgtB [Skermanella mucosa]|uniref:ergothioneine biosynthesis protein EgtB n=1 Tax=Skermanella mucosa TaxID=1789672 RepID=UPI001E554DB8|nr:ergothioneine biosynthesis protein EgtB [Skermanella mucosa]UEM23162.1 ergothioneine biosynthesis protein EgtB [Skermanella mucosa]
MIDAMQDVIELAAAPSVRERLVRRFMRVRGRTVGLAAPLTPEDQIIQSMADVSPTKWHLAHTTWFFEVFVLNRYAQGYTAFDERFGYLFNSYYNNLGSRHPRPHRGMLSRPSADEVQRYRDHVNAACLRLIRQVPDETLGELSKILTLGFNHEQQHQELILTDIKHVFWSNPLLPAYQSAQNQPGATTAPQKWFEHAGGLVQIGCDGDGTGFCFDNETPRHHTYVQPFRFAGRPVTCGEYREFIEAGGYDKPKYWLSDGWNEVEAQQWRAPLYWQKQHGDWHVFTLSGLRPMVESDPVCHVSFYEAAAYAAWAGKRLPTEAEWELFGRTQQVDGNLMECGTLHPMASPCAGMGPWQMFGDVWEWTASPYSPYPGFKAPPGAVGEYNGKFMCNQMVLRGGSCVTPSDHVRATYRNFFPPAARWQFAGFRLAEDI